MLFVAAAPFSRWGPDSNNRGRRWWPLRGVLVVTCILVASCDGSSSHSVQYFRVGLSEPIQGLPRFIFVGYMDGQPFVRYDTNTKELLPQVSWIEEAAKDNPQYWNRNNQFAQNWEVWFRRNVDILMNRYNHTGGLHVLQWTSGCELRGDGSKGGYMQEGYDGRDFVAFDKETLTWTAADAQAQVTKRKWDVDVAFNQYRKSYLEQECIEWLQKYLHYDNERLLRKEPPEVKVTSRADYDNMETFTCRVDGFYPKDIEVVWTRDGKVWEQETLRGLVAPTSDGTYHTWISIKVDPKDKDNFQCRVDHASLENPMHFDVKETASVFNLSLIVGCIALVVLLVAVAIGILRIRKKRQDGYKAASIITTT